MRDSQNLVAFDYMNPKVPACLPVHNIPLIRATPESFRAYGTLVDDPDNHPVEIVAWPAAGWRAIDAGTGDEGGYAEGTFEFTWQGDMLFAVNQAVDDQYLLGWSQQPGRALKDNKNPDRSQLLIWHANYHPDGAQLFYPQDQTPFVVALALPGDDVKPEDFVAFYCDGSFGVCIDPNIWHEAIAPLAENSRFYDQQGKVHARVSCDFAREFGVFLSIPLRQPPD